MARKTVDPKAKAKRQKLIAGLGGVLLLGLLAFQVPRVLKTLHPAPSAANSVQASKAPASTAPLAPPTLAGSPAGSAGAPTAGVPSGAGITDPSSAPLSGAANQLVSFSRFRTKDPFAQQISQVCSTCPSSSNPTPAKPGSGAGPKARLQAVVARTKTAPARAATVANSKVTFARAPVANRKVTVATIAVNGISEEVGVGKSFPAASPVFSLVALLPSEAKIAIAGGSLETGAATVALALGKTLTLLNTADGSRYQLKLLSAH